MRIYFTASIAGKKKYLHEYELIRKHLEAHGHMVIADHIIHSSETSIKLETEAQRERFHKKLRHWIMSAHCMVVETSFPSVSVGFEISLALQLQKPVLVLFQNESPTLLSGYDNEKLVCEKYTTQTVKSILNDFLLFAKSQEEHRFTFYISSMLGHYLTKAAKKKNVPKSVYLRDLIEKDRNNTNQ